MSKVDYKDVQLRYHEGGEQEIKNLIEDGISLYVLKSAMRHIAEKDAGQGTRFEALLVKYGVLTDNRGPTKPREGEKRVYSVQQTRGNFFIRLPVEVLGVFPQDLVEAQFTGGKITVTVP
jgi:hypothetical protein